MALIENRPFSARAAATSFFFASDLDGLLQDLVLERLAPQQALKLADATLERFHFGLGHHRLVCA